MGRIYGRRKHYQKKATLLMTMSGIGEYSAILILGEIGDIKRFKTPKELVSYAGLCPGIYQIQNSEKSSSKENVDNHLAYAHKGGTLQDGIIKKHHGPFRTKR
jgi:hypothetical protein